MLALRFRSCRGCRVRSFPRLVPRACATGRHSAVSRISQRFGLWPPRREVRSAAANRTDSREPRRSRTTPNPNSVQVLLAVRGANQNASLCVHLVLVHVGIVESLEEAEERG